MLDLLSDGRLELGIGRGAYQREFNRMAGGLQQQVGVAYMQEMLPVLKQLWQGDCEHKGTYWSFPASTSVPKPLQKPHPPLWVAARQGSYDWAIAKLQHHVGAGAAVRQVECKRRFGSALPRRRR
jgi:alkanesulfonate monooxygenase SsuD/methylene tetrahydromethanopterin reductase-like flavin-dependent oxidoreductase (luciferase family)